MSLDQAAKYALELDAGGDKITMKSAERRRDGALQRTALDRPDRDVDAPRSRLGGPSHRARPNTIVQWIRLDAWSFIAIASEPLSAGEIDVRRYESWAP